MAPAMYLGLLCLLLAAVCAADDDDSVNRWVTPPVDGANHDYTGNPQYTVGDRVQLEWRTNATGPVDVVLFQDRGENKGAMVVDGTSLSTFTWTVSYGGLNKSLGNAFWLELQGAPVRVASHYFFIDDAPATTTTTTSSTSTTGTTTTTPSARTTGIETAAPLPATSSSSNSLSNGVVAGIAVGATLGGLLIVAAAVWWLFRARRRRRAPAVAMDKATEGAAGTEGAAYDYQPLGGEDGAHGTKQVTYDSAAEMSATRPPAEVSSTRPPVEMPSPRPLAELDGAVVGYDANKFRR